MPPSASYDSTGVQYHNISRFTFLSGATIEDVKVAYRSLNPSSAKGTILIPTCYSGWINTTLTFTSAPNDALKDYTIIIAAMLGNGESSSPSNHPDFPRPGDLHYEDVINAHYDLLTNGLGVACLEAVIGFSMGGQQAYHWAVMYPSFVKRIVSICSSARTSPHNYAFLEGPISALLNSSDYVLWKEAKIAAGLPVSLGYGEDTHGIVARRGLKAFGRAYAAWLTSADWFREGHWRETLGYESVEEWLAKQEKDDQAWNADDLIALARMWQMGDIGWTAKRSVKGLGWKSDGDQALETALAEIEAHVLLMPNRNDQYFRPEDSEFEVKHLKRGQLKVIDSSWGHISGGGGCKEDAAFMSKTIAEFLTST